MSATASGLQQRTSFRALWRGPYSLRRHSFLMCCCSLLVRLPEVLPVPITTAKSMRSHHCGREAALRACYPFHRFSNVSRPLGTVLEEHTLLHCCVIRCDRNTTFNFSSSRRLIVIFRRFACNNSSIMPFAVTRLTNPRTLSYSFSMKSKAKVFRCLRFLPQVERA